MIASFTDLQDDDNPWNGRSLNDGQQVSQILDGLRAAQRPKMCQFTVSNRGSLLFGVGYDLGCVQYTREDDMPPYLMAVSRTSLPAPDELEFEVGGTMTPIARRYLISIGQVAEVVQQFVISGELSDEVAWEEFELS